MESARAPEWPTDSIGPADLLASRRHDRLRARGWALRVLVALGLIVGTAVLASDELPSVAAVMAWVWAPVAGLVDAVRRRHLGSPRHAFLAAVLDAVMLASVSALAPSILPVALAALVLLAACHLEVLGHGIARTGLWLVVAASMTAAWASAGSHPSAQAIGAAMVAGTVAVVAGLAWLASERAQFEASAAGNLAEERRRSGALLTGVGEAVVVTGPGGRIHRQNRGAERTFGCPTPAATGAMCHEILGLRQGLVELDCSGGCPLMAAADDGTVDAQVWRPLPGGQRQSLLVTATAVTDHDGATVEVLHSFRDVTELKKAEEAKTMFLATASHELKTPLTIIRGFAELLENSSLDEELRDRAVHTIHARSLELAGIVDRLLLSARIESGTVDLTLSHIPIDGRVAARAAATSAASGRRVDLSIPDEVPDVVASGEAIDTIVDHLVENAIKYSPDGAPVLVELTVQPDHVLLQVVDHGIGMSNVQAERCFDRFWQAEASDTRRFGGTGIGLYIVKSLAEAMHTEVTVDSVLGKGSCFALRLPRRYATAEPAAAAPQSRGERSMIDEFLRQVGVTGPGARP